MGPMGHDHGHSHGPALDADRKWLTVALVLIASFMAVEVVVGFIASSLALLSDAAHMLTDAGAIALALVAVRLAARPPSRRYTFGLGRAEILSAQANGATLLVLAGVLGDRGDPAAVRPADVEGGLVIVVGALGAAGQRRPPRSRCRAASGAGSTSRARSPTCSPTSTARWPR